MRALEKETDASAACMQPGTHPIALLGRADDRRRVRQRDLSNAPERILDDLALESELACIVDVREHVSATTRIARHRPPVHGWLEDFGNLRKGHAALGPFESRDHALTRNSAGDEHHPPLVTREHPATCCGLFDIECEQRHDPVYAISRTRLRAAGGARASSDPSLRGARPQRLRSTGGL